jgi:hypothetical protein
MEVGTDPKQLLWHSIQSLCRGAAEADFIKTDVGFELFERNQRAADELAVLIEILGDVSNAHPAAPGRGFGGPLHLARQLAMRDRVQQLFSHANSSPAFPSSRDRMVAEYIANGRQRPTSASSRPVSRSSRSSFAPDSRPSSGTPSHSQSGECGGVGGVQSSLHEIAQSGRLQYDKVAEIRDALRGLLEDEHDMLLADIDDVRQRIDEDMKWSRFAEPSAAEITRLQDSVSEFEKQQEHETLVNSFASISNRRLTPLVPSPPRR